MFELIKNLHATAWYRHAHVCLSKRRLLFSPFLKRQPQLYIMCTMQEYGIFCCLHPYLVYPYLSIIDRTTNRNLLLQGLETGYQAYRDIWQCQTWSKAMIDKLYSQKLVSDQVNTVDREEEEEEMRVISSIIWLWYIKKNGRWKKCHLRRRCHLSITRGDQLQDKWSNFHCPTQHHPRETHTTKAISDHPSIVRHMPATPV